MSFELVDLPGDSMIAEITSPAFSTSYPRVTHKERIPRPALAAMEASWKAGHFDKRKVRLVLLRNVFVAGEGIVFDRDRKVISQILTQQVREHIARAKNELETAINARTLRTITNPAVLCVKPGWRNYGHWLLEMLPIADLANRIIFERDLRFLVAAESGSKMEQVVHDSLDMVGISRTNAISYEIKPVFLEKLICVLGLTMHGSYMSPLIFNPINRMQEGQSSLQQRNIYIKRSSRYPRSFVNEDEVEAVVRARGYTIICPEEHSLAEQISIFKGARKIIGIAGAAMTNICFGCAGAHAMIFYPERMPDSFFWFIASHKNLNFSDYRCKQVGNPKTHCPWDSDLYIECSDLDKLL